MLHFDVIFKNMTGPDDNRCRIDPQGIMKTIDLLQNKTSLPIIHL